MMIACSKATSDRLSDKTLLRTIKRQIWSQEQSIWLIPPPGLSHVTEEEATKLLGSLRESSTGDGPSIQSSQDAVIVQGLKFREILELGMRLQTARDAFWCLGEAKVETVKELKNALKKIRWDLILPKEEGLRVEVRSFKSRLYHESRLQETIEESLQAAGWQTHQKSFQHRLRFYLNDNRLYVLLALSATPLYQRNFRQSLTAKAPLAEHYAASLIRWWWSEYEKSSPGLTQPSQLYVPFAGSGTFAWEYFLWYYQIAPGLIGKSFAFESWICTPQATVSYLKKHLSASPDAELSSLPSALKLYLYDRDEHQVEELMGHLDRFLSIHNFYLKDDAKVACHDFFQVTDLPAADAAAPLVVLINPPYGHRLASSKAEVTYQRYQRIGAHLKAQAQSYSAFTGVILFPDEHASRYFVKGWGQPLQGQTHFTQGGLHIRAAWFSCA